MIYYQESNTKKQNLIIISWKDNFKHLIFQTNTLSKSQQFKTGYLQILSLPMQNTKIYYNAINIKMNIIYILVIHNFTIFCLIWKISFWLSCSLHLCYTCMCCFFSQSVKLLGWFCLKDSFVMCNVIFNFFFWFNFTLFCVVDDWLLDISCNYFFSYIIAEIDNLC